MLTSMILALAVSGQAPTGPKTDAELRALAAQIRARAASPQAQAKMQAEKVRQKESRDAFLKRWYAERPAREAEARARREAAAKAQAEAQKKAEADYKAMLPYMLEAQRQQIERMGQMERNAILQRMAATAEFQAQTDKQRADYFAWWVMKQR